MYTCVLEVKTPGPFEAAIEIHLDEGVLRSETIQVSGTVRAPVPVPQE